MVFADGEDVFFVTGKFLARLNGCITGPSSAVLRRTIGIFMVVSIESVSAKGLAAVAQSVVFMSTHFVFHVMSPPFSIVVVCIIGAMFRVLGESNLWLPAEPAVKLLVVASIIVPMSRVLDESVVVQQHADY